MTHAHTDHTGFAEQARATTGARVWIHENDVQMARTGKVGSRDGKQSAYLLRGAFWRTVLILGMRGGTTIIPVQEVSGFGPGWSSGQIEETQPAGRTETAGRRAACAWQGSRGSSRRAQSAPPGIARSAAAAGRWLGLG